MIYNTDLCHFLLKGNPHVVIDEGFGYLVNNYPLTCALNNLKSEAVWKCGPAGGNQFQLRRLQSIRVMNLGAELRSSNNVSFHCQTLRVKCGATFHRAESPLSPAPIINPWPGCGSYK